MVHFQLLQSANKQHWYYHHVLINLKPASFHLWLHNAAVLHSLVCSAKTGLGTTFLPKCITTCLFMWSLTLVSSCIMNVFWIAPVFVLPKKECLIRHFIMIWTNLKAVVPSSSPSDLVGLKQLSDFAVYRYFRWIYNATKVPWHFYIVHFYSI